MGFLQKIVKRIKDRDRQKLERTIVSDIVEKDGRLRKLIFKNGDYYIWKNYNDDSNTFKGFNKNNDLILDVVKGDGFGKFQYDGGMTYTGEFKNVSWHGKGKYEAPYTQIVIEGEWREGKEWNIIEHREEQFHRKVVNGKEVQKIERDWLYS